MTTLPEPTDPGPGSIIAFDGIDCSGKTTQISLLASNLEVQERPVHIDARSWDGHIGRALAALIADDDPPPAECLAHLFTAEAILRFRSTVMPKLSLGSIVLSDRSYYSGFAYNIAIGATSWEWNEICNGWAVEPRIALFIDVDPEVAWIRRCTRRERAQDRIEVAFEVDAKAAFIRTQEMARRVFRRFADEGRLTVVDGERDMASVATEIWNIVSRWLGG